MTEPLLTKLVDTLIKENGSDLHLSPGSPPVLRVSGALLPLVQEERLTPAKTEAILKSIAPEGRLSDFAKNQSIDFSYAHGDAARLRVNGYIVGGTVAIAMRLIPREIRALAELNLPPVLETFAERRQGFFLCVGPVGQGKSTTLAAMIDRINDTRAAHILTIEDPVEYLFTPKKSLIHQREVHVDVPSFAEALTSAFREDMDVIMVGEMRDHDTVSNAVTAA
ncbi:MAG: type IV pilus twitching motility protein PilT, partial [Minisyncoccia bacterium]